MKVDHAKLLRTRAAIAVALGDEEAARLLRGFASTVAADGRSASRVRARIQEQIERLLGPIGETPIAQVWRDACADLAGQIPLPLSAPERVAAPPRAREEDQAHQHRLSDLEAVVAAQRRRAEEVEAEVVVLRRALEEHKRHLEDHAAILADLRERPPQAPAPSVSIADKLKVRMLPDGRSWWDLLVEIAPQHGATADEAASRLRYRPLGVVRAHHWWWLRHNTRVGLIQIGNAWGVDHSTVASGVAKHERALAQQAAVSAPPSGPRALEDLREAS